MGSLTCLGEGVSVFSLLPSEALTLLPPVCVAKYFLTMSWCLGRDEAEGVRMQPATLVESSQELMLISGPSSSWRLVVYFHLCFFPEHFMASLENSPISEDFCLGSFARSNTSLSWIHSCLLPPLLGIRSYFQLPSFLSPCSLA